MLALLRQRNFALIWSGGTLSGMGDAVLYAALPYYVYEISRSVTATGGVVLSEVVPTVLMSTIGGVFADRLRRKPAIVLSNLCRGAILLSLLLVHDRSTLWIVYTSGFVNALISSFTGPFGGAALPHVVSKEDLPAANGAFAAGRNLTLVVGTPLGGLLLQQFGFAPVVVIDALSFLIPALTITLISVPLEARPEPASRLGHPWAAPLRDWLHGWQYIRRTPVVTRIFLVDVPRWLAGAIVTVVFVAFVRRVLGGSPLFFSWTLALQAASSIVGGLIIGQLTRRLAPDRLAAVSLLFLGVLTIVEVIAALQPVTIAISVLVGAPVLFTGASLTTLLQAGVADSFRGRVLGSYSSAVNLVGLVGVMAATLLTERIGIRLMLGAGGVLLLIGGSMAIRLLPSTTA